MRLHQRIRREQGRHTDDWLITYADTITLLLCLFVIILSIKTADKTLPRDAPAPADRPPALVDIFGDSPPFNTLTRAADPVTDDRRPHDAGDTTEPEPEQPLLGNIAGVETPRDPSGDLMERGPVSPRQAVSLPDAVAPLSVPVAEVPEAAAPSLPSIVNRLQSQGTQAAEQRGDRITTLQISSAAFFGSGNAALSVAGKAILRDVAVTLKSAEFAPYHVSIEGHTDDIPISTPQFQSNWELSTSRAAAVVRFFLEEGIPARKLTAAGYSDTYPIVPNRTADGTVIPENQARNRRVVIKLEKIDKAER